MGEVLYDGKDSNCVIEDNVLYNKEKTVLMKFFVRSKVISQCPGH